MGGFKAEGIPAHERGDKPSADPEKNDAQGLGFLGIWLMLLVTLPTAWVVAGAGLWFADADSRPHRNP